MADFFQLLFWASVLVALIGWRRPELVLRWSTAPTRAKALGVFGSLALLSLLGSIGSAPASGSGAGSADRGGIMLIPALAFFLSVLAMGAGLLWPEKVMPWSRNPTRGRAVGLYFTAAFVSLFLLGSLAPEKKKAGKEPRAENRAPAAAKTNDAPAASRQDQAKSAQTPSAPRTQDRAAASPRSGVPSQTGKPAKPQAAAGASEAVSRYEIALEAAYAGPARSADQVRNTAASGRFKSARLYEKTLAAAADLEQGQARLQQLAPAGDIPGDGAAKLAAAGKKCLFALAAYKEGMQSLCNWLETRAQPALDAAAQSLDQGDRLERECRAAVAAVKRASKSAGQQGVRGERPKPRSGQ